jgi:hypothetical protein
MPTYEFTSPDGKTYEVSGPGSSSEAFAILQGQLGGTKTEAVAAPAARGTNFMASFEDVLSGDRQTPGVAGKLLGPATIGEEGEVYIKGPNGELTPTDDSKHIKVGDKIFERSALEKYQLPGGDAASALAAGLQSFSPLKAATAARMTNVAAREIPAVAAEATPMTELAGALQRGQMTMPRGLAGNRLQQQLAGGLENAPIIGGELTGAKQASLESAQAAIDRLSRGLGAGSVEEAGLTARRGLRDFIERGKTAESAPNYQGIEDVIDPTAVSPLSQTRDLYTKLMAEHGAKKLPGKPQYLDMIEGAIAPATDPNAVRRAALLKEYGGSEKLVDQIERQLGPAAGEVTPEGLSVSGARSLRSDVLGKLRDTTPGTPEHNRLKSMSGALGGDIENMLRTQGGPEVISQLEQANRIHRELSDSSRRLAKITGVNEDATPAKIFNRIAGMAKSKAREDLSGLAEIKHVLGDDMDEITSALVARMGRDNKGNFSPNNFLRDYEEIASEAKPVLFSSAHREALDDIQTYSKKFVESQQYRNTSGTTRTSAILAPIAVLHSLDFSMLSTMAGYALTTKYLAKPLDVSKILANPASAAAAAKWTKAYTTYSQYNTAASAAALRLASRNLLNNIKEDKPEK